MSYLCLRISYDFLTSLFLDGFDFVVPTGIRSFSNGCVGSSVDCISSGCVGCIMSCVAPEVLVGVFFLLLFCDLILLYIDIAIYV